jgi:hypothetical protein
MAGQLTIPVEQIQKGQIIPVNRTFENAELIVGSGTQNHPLFLNNTGKRLVIQRASVRANVANGANAGATIARRGNGVNAAGAVTVTGSLPLTTADTLADFTLLTSGGQPSQNIIEVNEMVTLNVTADPGALDRLVVALVLTETVY